MPRTLKLYITGVVTLSAVALSGRDFLVSPGSSRDRPRLGSRRSRSRRTVTDYRSSAGIAFWTLVTLVASAAPGPAPSWLVSGRCVGPDRGGDDARWASCRRLGRRDRTTEMRELRGRIPGTAP